MHTRVTQNDSLEFKGYFDTKKYTVDSCKKEYLGWEHSPQTVVVAIVDYTLFTSVDLFWRTPHSAVAYFRFVFVINLQGSRAEFLFNMFKNVI